MTENERRDMNRRVAVAMGWKWIKTRKNLQCGPPIVFHASFKHPDSLPSCVQWEEWKGTPEEAHAEALKAGGDPYWGVPPYCTDPAAADLVRQEIERRWGHYYEAIDPFTRRVSISPKGRVRILLSRHPDYELFVLRCEAFIAACEAEKATKAEETPE